ncbi:MAG: hypothetical protein II979_05925, partial [Clostridia bacterium]|nr:hypothetical protein [Clostridia bacterium]
PSLAKCSTTVFKISSCGLVSSSLNPMHMSVSEDRSEGNDAPKKQEKAPAESKTPLPSAGAKNHIKAKLCAQ